jgi:DNA-binding response OmpR family regulator
MGSTVLVVEDERKLRELLRAYFERENLVVYSTSSGAEAIEVGRRSSVDLVVLDLGLPDLPGEVLRVQAVLRRGRSATEEAPVASYGGGELVIDNDRRRVLVRGEPVELTPTEWGILTTLARVPGRVYSRYELINQVRGYEFEGYERTVNSHIKNLRHKVELEDGKPRLLETVLGGGYRLGLLRDP